jgi:hypothetical protein
MTYLLGSLPHPEDKSAAARRPYQRIVGVYVLKRAPFDTEVEIYEPGEDRNTYILEYFEMETWLRNVMNIRGEFFRRICDMLWNFHIVAFHPDVERCISLRNSDVPGWEEEISLGFKDEESYAGT